MGDVARSDVALAAATLIFGPLLLSGLRGGSGTPAVLLDLGVVLLLTAAVPLLLIRSRASSGGRSATAVLALDGHPTDIASGLGLAVPVAVAGAVAMSTAGATPASAMLGRLSGAPLQVLQVAAFAIGTLVFVVFLTVRGAEAFPRSPEWALRRLLRTFGMGAAALALVAGLLRVPAGANPVRVLTNAVALAAVVLIADRVLGSARSVPRLAVVLPAGLALYLHVTAFGLSTGLQAGALAAGMTVVLATVALSARGAWPLVPLVVAVNLWPTCLTPLALVRGLC
jgi:hypothetical protein